MEETSCEGRLNSERYGAQVARAAFEGMDNDNKREEDVSSDAQAFIEECERSGRDPLEVVKFVAGRNGIELAGKRPEDSGKAAMYDLLREVVGIVVNEFFEEDWDEEEEDEEEKQVPAADFLVSRSLPIRKCRKFWYAFTW